jgi:formylglycine-generating enzyme required for sulfatase activity
MAGNVNNWCLDWFWPEFYAYLAEAGPEERIDPALDTALAKKLGAELTKRTDRGGGFATPVGCLSVIGTTRRLGWSPDSREPWQGFRTVSSSA